MGLNNFTIPPSFSCHSSGVKNNTRLRIFLVTSVWGSLKDPFFDLLNVSSSFTFLKKGRNLNSKISPDTLNFSGGEKQRISIARALYHIKPILIMDEATNGLDEKSELKIIKEILKKYKKTTVILVSHNLGLKENFSKRLVLG